MNVMLLLNSTVCCIQTPSNFQFNYQSWQINKSKLTFPIPCMKRNQVAKKIILDDKYSINEQINEIDPQNSKNKRSTIIVIVAYQELQLNMVYNALAQVQIKYLNSNANNTQIKDKNDKLESRNQSDLIKFKTIQLQATQNDDDYKLLLDRIEQQSNYFNAMLFVSDDKSSHFKERIYQLASQLNQIIPSYIAVAIASSCTKQQEQQLSSNRIQIVNNCQNSKICDINKDISIYNLVFSSPEGIQEISDNFSYETQVQLSKILVWGRSKHEILTVRLNNLKYPTLNQESNDMYENDFQVDKNPANNGLKKNNKRQSHDFQFQLNQKENQQLKFTFNFQLPNKNPLEFNNIQAFKTNGFLCNQNQQVQGNSTISQQQQQQGGLFNHLQDCKNQNQPTQAQNPNGLGAFKYTQQNDQQNANTFGVWVNAVQQSSDEVKIYKQRDEKLRREMILISQKIEDQQNQILLWKQRYKKLWNELFVIKNQASQRDKQINMQDIDFLLQKFNWE